MLEGRVRVFEGRPRRCGTQVDWDEHGVLVPLPGVEEPETVDARRAGVALPPLAEALAALRARAVTEGHRPPADLAAYRAAAEAWARAAGWRA